MKINEVIRKYRKEANFTQEQIANYLGVTAPAVNKWENDISCPDITLLAPLARILKIDVDTLLSFNEELTKLEISQRVAEISELVQKEGFEKAFKKGEQLIREYPKCDALILPIAQILNAFLKIQGVKDAAQYEVRIMQWYELAATSDQQEIVSTATAALVSKYMEKEAFDRAQQLLDKIPPLGFDKQISQAMLYEKQGNIEAAHEVYEQMLLKDVNEISSIIQFQLGLLIKEEAFEIAERYVRIGKEVAELFDLGTYNAYVPELYVATKKRDVNRSLDALEKVVKGLDTVSNFTRSDLYAHMKLRESVSLEFLRNMIRRGLERDTEIDFLRAEPRFKMIIKLLGSPLTEELVVK